MSVKAKPPPCEGRKLTPHSFLIAPEHGSLELRISDDMDAIEVGFGDDVVIFTGPEMMLMLKAALKSLRSQQRTTGRKAA